MNTNTSLAAEKPHVLLVDDEVSIRISLSKILQLKGFNVKTASDAEEALRWLEKAAFDVVISDIVLPRVDGITLLKQIRRLRPELRVIMFTGEPTVETSVEALRAGAFDYLVKPLAPNVLVDTLNRALSDPSRH